MYTTYEKPVILRKKIVSSSHRKKSNFNQHKQNSEKLLKHEKERSSSKDEDTPNFENNNIQTDSGKCHFNFDTFSKSQGASSNGLFQNVDYDTTPNINKKYTRDRSKMFSFGFGLS